MAGIRRTWDKELYEKKARDRVEHGDEYVDGESTNKAKARNIIKEEFQAAGDDAAGPMGSQRAFLNARETKVDLDGKVGKIEMINPTNATAARGAGFWCEVCTCLLKDSASYLDHINGRKHQKALGFSMRVERADVGSVKSRLDEMKRKLDANKYAASLPKKSKREVFTDYEAKLNNELAEISTAKQRKKQEKEAAKQKEIEEKKAIDEAEAEGEGADNKEMMAMMGFGAFGSTK